MPRGKAKYDPAMLAMALVGYEIEKKKIDEKIKELRAQIGGGESDFPPTLITPLDQTVQAVRSAKCHRGRGHITGRDTRTDIGGTYRCLSLPEQIDSRGLESERLPEFSQRGDVARRSVTEPKVRTDDHVGCIQTRDEHMMGELSRFQPGKLERERQCAKHVDTELLDEFGSANERGQLTRVRTWPNHLRRMRDECH